MDFPALTVIPGVELSTDTDSGEVHILGYFVDYGDREFKPVLIGCVIPVKTERKKW